MFCFLPFGHLESNERPGQVVTNSKLLSSHLEGDLEFGTVPLLSLGWFSEIERFSFSFHVYFGFALLHSVIGLKKLAPLSRPIK